MLRGIRQDWCRNSHTPLAGSVAQVAEGVVVTVVVVVAEVVRAKVGREVEMVHLLRDNILHSCSP